MNMEQLNRLYPLGSHLCREPMPPMSELKRDMENLKRHGFNLIKLQEHWQTDEPLEGRYDFSRYEELIDYAARLDLAVYLGLTCEQAPAWLWRKHPGCRMVRRDGLPVAYEAQAPLKGDGKPGPCYDHAGARADMVRFIGQLVRTLGRFENIVVWNTWQEIGYWAEQIAGGQVCYCEHTLEYFRQWLCEKYGDLDGLNRAWNSRYLDWSDVQPERGTTPQALPHEVDWHYFMDNVQIARVLRTRAEAIRAEDRLGRPIFAHKSIPEIGTGQDWIFARCQDFLASSTYPGAFSMHEWDDARADGRRVRAQQAALANEMWDGVALRQDHIRSANRRGSPLWGAEFQGGPVSTFLHWGRVPSAADLRRWMLTAVGSGVTAIAFWVTRAEIAASEVNGFSLLDSEGESTPRYEEVTRIGRALNRHADLFGRPTWPGAEVGIVVDEWNHCFCMSLRAGGGHLGYSVRGWHRLLWELGIPVDFVEASRLDEPEAAAYRALIVPFPISMSEAVAERLAHFADSGGAVICEACPGRLNEHAYANRGELSPAARRLFGVRHESLALVAEPDDGDRWSFEERTWGEFVDPAMLVGVGPLQGKRARANLYIETFACEGAEPCLKLGEAVAGTVRQVGRGRAWLLGTLLGHNGTAYRDVETRAFVRSLLEECGVRPMHAGRLLLRKRVAEGKEAWLFTNPTDQDVTESVGVQGWSEVDDLLGEPLARDGDSVSLTVPSLDVRVLILRPK